MGGFMGSARVNRLGCRTFPTSSLLPVPEPEIFSSLFYIFL